MAPRVGFEPTTLRLTAGCSTVELPRKVKVIIPKNPTQVNNFIDFKIYFREFFK